MLKRPFIKNKALSYCPAKLNEVCVGACIGDDMSFMASPGGLCYKMRACIGIPRQDFQGICNILKGVFPCSSQILFFHYMLQLSLHDLLHPVLEIGLEKEF